MCHLGKLPCNWRVERKVLSRISSGYTHSFGITIFDVVDELLVRQFMMLIIMKDGQNQGVRNRSERISGQERK
jgi:hypothetical protein